jgi:hypothetical protein
LSLFADEYRTWTVLLYLSGLGVYGVVLYSNTSELARGDIGSGPMAPSQVDVTF